ncbi:uncharacterized protein BDZ99DRAFT_566575 [Mytilinidion resinicola]|uniref:Helix-turn-helix domain-containing protein n=1 Tax=Mytilinidion resinicola TaxID=574789 RepID=A0A6A6Z1K6_9PEZI|nr:uncharacterized protein BDZ99DRAFT_566575 [Mytilinidion resinicola]KAF2814609.1 hypothetical protein BDZ99DRAFT_566575 [Mytilinidion resinicola]
MGSSVSKGARAAGNAARKYPTRVTNATNTPSSAPPVAPGGRPGPTVHPTPQASQAKTEAINLDGQDPTFAAQLRSLGAVQPNPHYSSTSTSPLDPQRSADTDYTSQPTSQYPSAYPDPSTNPALTVLAARTRLQELAEEELSQTGRRGFQGRSFVDVAAVRQAMMLVQRGETQSKAEETVGLKKGRLGALGRGIVEAV